MGKKDKKEKKVKGAEKTALKTEKKATLKLKKQLKAVGEEDVETLIAEIQEYDRKREQITEEISGPPSVRSNFSISPHPEKGELLLFGGEYFNGSKTFMYNQLFIYDIKKNSWVLLHSPGGPAPRCAHQAVCVPQGGGQLWIFGGEFASPSQMQFYHYKDLWVLHLQTKKWDKISVSGGPSARSGHRMVACKKQLIVFGGYHDNSRDYKYFNDVYAFNLETRKWSKLVPSGTPPLPRSGCQMAALSDGRVLVYGGYSKERLKKDVDKGHVHTDMFYLQPEKGDVSGTKWRWVSVKQTGVKPPPRCSATLAVAAGSDRAYMFGGIYDKEETEDALEGQLFNDFYQLELDKARWHRTTLSGSSGVAGAAGKRRRAAKDQPTTEEGDHQEERDDDDQEPCDEGAEIPLAPLSLQDNSATVAAADNAATITTYDDGVFTVKVGPQSSSSTPIVTEGTSRLEPTVTDGKSDALVPSPRMSPGMVVKGGSLYLYGGLVEEGDRNVTLDDFYSLDLRKLDTWQTIFAGTADQQDWVDTDSSGGEDQDEEDNDDDESEGGSTEGATGGKENDSEESDESETEEAMDAQ